MTDDLIDATYVAWPVHETDPTAHQMAGRLTAHFHAQCTTKTDWNRGVVNLRIVAPAADVDRAVALYLGERDVPYTITRGVA